MVSTLFYSTFPIKRGSLCPHANGQAFTPTWLTRVRGSQDRNNENISLHGGGRTVVLIEENSSCLLGGMNRYRLNRKKGRRERKRKNKLFT